MSEGVLELFECRYKVILFAAELFYEPSNTIPIRLTRLLSNVFGQHIGAKAAQVRIQGLLHSLNHIVCENCLEAQRLDSIRYSKPRYDCVHVEERYSPCQSFQPACPFIEYIDFVKIGKRQSLGLLFRF